MRTVDSMPSARDWQMRKVKTRVWVEVDRKHDGWASRSAVGIVCVIVAKWSGHLVKQAVYPWDLLQQLSPQGRSRTFMDFFKDPEDPPSPVGGTPEVEYPADLRERAPTLGHFMCDPLWPSGKARLGASLIIFCEGGQYKVCLSERNRDKSLWATAKLLDDVLEALEGRLTEDVVDWRKSRTRGKRS